MKAVFWLVITALAQISRLRFKQSRISMLIPEINSFSQRISKIYGNRNFEDLWFF